MHKYMDDTTLTVKVHECSSGSMQTHVNQAVSWSTTNKMIPNVDKTKDIVISFHKQPLDISPIFIEGIDIEPVKSVKLLDIIVTDKIKLNENTNYICSRASKRLYHLKQLRRAGVNSVDLLAFYKSVIRSVLEYAFPVWHTSQTVADSSRIESIQRRAMKIIELELEYDARVRNFI